jgi:hypothetical protein
MKRGINEGRMAARDVDKFLTGLGGTRLPVSGGVVKKLPYEMLVKLGAVAPAPEENGSIIKAVDGASVVVAPVEAVA